MKKTDISVTTEAMLHLQQQLNRQQGECFLLILKKDGCSGYQFSLDVKNDLSDDWFQVNNILYVPKRYISSISGLQISLEQQGQFGYKLSFNLSNATDYCGCGKSFKLAAELINNSEKGS